MNTTMQPRVTILMPMKNAESFVEVAARSVLEQQDVELELVVIDDGSTDGSRRVVQSLDDPRVRIVDGPTRGISAAINTGLEAARGEYLGRCDADDRYAPGRLAMQVRALDERRDCVAVCSAFAMMDPRGRHLADLDQREQEEDITDELLGGDPRTHLNTYLMRTEAVRRIGGCREYFVSAEDIDLQFRLASLGRVVWSPRVGYYYRLHDHSIVHTQANALRKHYDRTARLFAQQRASGAPDDLERGEPPRTPEDADAGPSHSGRRHRQEILLGAAWREHSRGRRVAALTTGWRACMARPEGIQAWRSFVVLVLRSSARRS